MVESINEEGTRFVKDYYKTITRTPKLLQRFYSPSAQISISHEAEEPKVHTENHVSVVQDKHRKKIEKVLISSLDCQKIGEMLFVAVVGEFVYSNSTIVRYTQQFVVERGERYRIVNDNCRLLDEEVVFETKKPKKEGSAYDNRIGSKVNFDRGALIKVVGGTDISRSRMFDAFHNVGRIWAIETRENKCFVEFANAEDLQKIRGDEILKNYGFEVSIVEPFTKNY